MLRDRIILPLGITPARAGKTVRLKEWRPDRWDHPRPCGKDFPTGEDKAHNTGSPPPVRERRVPIRPVHVESGITPARAGKTL